MKFIKFQFSIISLIFFFSISLSIGQTYPGTMISIIGGPFIMGNNNPPPMFDDQDPEHSVTIEDFQMGETEVTNADYVVFLNEMTSLGNLFVKREFLVIGQVTQLKFPMGMHGVYWRIVHY